MQPVFNEKRTFFYQVHNKQQISKRKNENLKNDRSRHEESFEFKLDADKIVQRYFSRHIRIINNNVLRLDYSKTLNRASERNAIM